jgi:hypothetical protein
VFDADDDRGLAKVGEGGTMNDTNEDAIAPNVKGPNIAGTQGDPPVRRKKRTAREIVRDAIAKVRAVELTREEQAQHERHRAALQIKHQEQRRQWDIGQSELRHIVRTALEARRKHLAKMERQALLAAARDVRRNPLSLSWRTLKSVEEADAVAVAIKEDTERQIAKQRVAQLKKVIRGEMVEARTPSPPMTLRQLFEGRQEGNGERRICDGDPWQCFRCSQYRSRRCLLNTPITGLPN